MKIIRILFKNLLVLIVLLVLASPLWLKFLPSKYFNIFVNKSLVINKLVCNFSTKISGESMDPIIAPGTAVKLNRCFDQKDLTENTVIIYKDNSILRFGIIRHILLLDPIVYKISDEKSPDNLRDIVKENIVGITHDFDLSKTKYQFKAKTESFILFSNEFLSDFYLAKIPKGMGIEMTTPEKTTIFSIQKDKFCSVIFPKKKLFGVDSEIIDDKTQKIIPLGKEGIFDLQPNPNINCSEFGSSQGMLNLKKGNYHYRLLINHQVLQNIPFIVN